MRKLRSDFEVTTFAPESAGDPAWNQAFWEHFPLLGNERKSEHDEAALDWPTSTGR